MLTVDRLFFTARHSFTVKTQVGGALDDHPGEQEGRTLDMLGFSLCSIDMIMFPQSNRYILLTDCLLTGDKFDASPNIICR